MTATATMEAPAADEIMLKGIKLISARVYPPFLTQGKDAIEQVPIQVFHNWWTTVQSYQLDIETNVVEDLLDREVYVMQFGSMDGTLQFVVDYASLPQEGKEYFHKILKDNTKQKIIHNALFEYTVIKQCCGVEIDNIYDTFLALKVITNGKNVPDGFYSLAGALQALFDITMSKDEQTTFNGGIMTLEQIVYAATDVRYMHLIKARLESLPAYKEQALTIDLENRAVRSVGDIMSNGFLFDTEVWEENLEWVGPQIEEKRSEIYKIMKSSDFLRHCIELGFVCPQDKATINWNSNPQRAVVLADIYPDLANYKLEALRKFEKTLEEGNLLSHIIAKDYDKASDIALRDHRDVLDKHGYLQKQGDVLINLNSPAQRLNLFRLIDPKLENTKEDSLKHLSRHPMIAAYSDYISTEKLATSYGRNWYEFIGKDGRIRPRFCEQILETGRIAYRKPGIMTVPADSGYFLGDRYRKAFLPTPGWKIVTSDFASQELVICGYLAGEDVWLDTIKNGGDLHSKCACLVFGDKWVRAGGHPTGAEKPGKDAMEAVKLRDSVKTISFGLIYGGGAGMISSRLDISKQEAKDLIELYFATFPKLRAFLEGLAEFGMKYGYITTAAPFRRRRYFPEWRKGHMDKKDISSIERQSKNSPIQGTAADASKYALYLVKKFIEDNGLQDRVRLMLSLHDAIQTEARDDYADTWAPQLQQLMIQAHMINIPDGLVGSETTVTDYWTK